MLAFSSSERHGRGRQGPRRDHHPKRLSSLQSSSGRKRRTSRSDDKKHRRDSGDVRRNNSRGSSHQKKERELSEKENSKPHVPKFSKVGWAKCLNRGPTDDTLISGNIRERSQTGDERRIPPIESIQRLKLPLQEPGARGIPPLAGSSDRLSKRSTRSIPLPSVGSSGRTSDRSVQSLPPTGMGLRLGASQSKDRHNHDNSSLLNSGTAARISVSDLLKESRAAVNETPAPGGISFARGRGNYRNQSSLWF